MPVNVILYGAAMAFGDSGFGDGGFDDSGFGDMAVPSSSFFLHDTLEKLILLLVLSGLAIFVHKKFRRMRKPLLVLSILASGFYFGGFLCPVTAVQNVFVRYNSGFILLFLVPVVLTIFWGQIFCGNICPFGACQELLHRKKLGKKVPPKLNRALSNVKYVLLIGLVAHVLMTGTILGIGLTPFKALFQFGGTTAAIVITSVTALLSIVLARPFCRYACPLGAFLTIVARIKRHRASPKKFLHRSGTQNKAAS